MFGPHKLERYITLDLKSLTGTNTLAYLTHFLVMKKMKWSENEVNMELGLMLLNFLRPLFTKVRNKLVFVPGRPFHPSLMFVGKFRSLP